jgi:hypothetical protein
MCKFCNWGGGGYAEYQGEARSKPTTGEKQGYQASVEDRAKQDKATAAQNETLGQVSGDLGYYTGDPSKSPLYRTLVTTGVEGTNRAYNDAKASTTLRAKIAGFGNTSGVAKGADRELEAERGADLARVPREALSTAVDRQMQAEGMKLAVGSQQGGQAESYGSQGTQYFGTAANAENQRLARRAALMNALISAGSSVATGGVSSGGRWS